MKIAYLDASACVAILFGEDKGLKWQKLLNRQEEIVSASLIEAEVFSAAAREKVPLHKAEILLDCVSLVYPDRALRKEYHQIFSLGYVKGAAAQHLATALYLDPEAKGLTFVTADSQQKKLAKQMGFKVV